MEKTSIKQIVTQELLSTEVKKNARFPFLSGVIRGTGELHFSFGGFILEIRHKNEDFVNYCVKIVNSIYGSDLKIGELDYNVNGAKEQIYSVFVPQEISRDLLSKCHVVTSDYEYVVGVPKGFLDSTTARRAFLRGLFLACGSVRVPSGEDDGQKSAGYTLSFNLNSDKVLSDVIALLNKEALIDKDAVRLKEKSNFVYIKNSEAVCNVLTALGSVRGALDTYGIIAKRQVLNNANRVKNCDLANIDKTVKAVAKQMDAIERIKRSSVYDTLSDDLKKTCEIRENFPDLGLEELGKEFNPPVGKSCLNHRLRKIVQIAENLPSHNNVN